MEHISISLSGLVAKLEGLCLSEELVKKQIAQIVQELCGGEINPREIKYQNGNLIINCDRYLKSELFVNKKELIERIEKEVLRDKKVLRVK
jgi:hypothetical protein